MKALIKRLVVHTWNVYKLDRLRRKTYKKYKKWMKATKFSPDKFEIPLDINPLFSIVLEKEDFDEYMKELIYRRKFTNEENGNLR